MKIVSGERVALHSEVIVDYFNESNGTTSASAHTKLTPPRSTVQCSGIKFAHGKD